MANSKHKLMIAYLEISDWLKNFKDFSKLSLNDIKDNLSKEFTYSHIPEEDQEAMIEVIVDLFKIIKR